MKLYSIEYEEFDGSEHSFNVAANRLDDHKMHEYALRHLKRHYKKAVGADLVNVRRRLLNRIIDINGERYRVKLERYYLTTTKKDL